MRPTLIQVYHYMIPKLFEPANLIQRLKVLGQITCPPRISHIVEPMDHLADTKYSWYYQVKYCIHFLQGCKVTPA